MLQQPGKTQTLDLNPVTTRTYTADKPTRIISTASLFIDIQQPLVEKLEGQIGIDFAATSSSKVSYRGAKDAAR